MIFGIVEFGRALWLKSALDFSVVEAARCASVNPTRCGTPDRSRPMPAPRRAAVSQLGLFKPRIELRQPGLRSYSADPHHFRAPISLTF